MAAGSGSPASTRPPNPKRVRKIIGLAGQYASIEPAMKGIENLRMIARLFGLSRRDAEIAATDVLERLDLADAGDRLVRTYSGGMRRRLDLGASLVGRPQLLLLDEPTTGLDPRGRMDLWAAIRNLVADGTDVLLTTQYLEEADQLARHIVIVDHGRVISAGTPDELKDQAGRNVIEVRPRSGGDLPAVEETLARIGCEAPHTDMDTQRVSARVEGGGEQLRDVVRLLDERGIEVDDVGLRRPSLDEVFLVGHRPAPRPDRPRLAVGRGRRGLIPGAPMTTTDTLTTNRTTATRVAPATGANWVTASLQSAKRTILQFFRTPQLLMLGTVQGALFLFMFRYIFGGAINPGGGLDYVDFLVPGFLVTGILWLGMPASSGVAEDATTGVHDRLRSLPIPRSSVMFGRSIADTALTLWGLLITGVLAFVFGFRLHADALDVLLAVALLVIATYSFMWVFITIGLVSSSAQAANGMATLLVIPVAFISAAYVPADSLPSWLQPVADNQPFTVLSNALRSLTLGGTDAVGIGHTTTHWVVLSLVWCAGIFLVFSTIAVSRFSRRR